MYSKKYFLKYTSSSDKLCPFFPSRSKSNIFFLDSEKKNAFFHTKESPKLPW